MSGSIYAEAHICFLSESSETVPTAVGACVPACVCLCGFGYVFSLSGEQPLPEAYDINSGTLPLF